MTSVADPAQPDSAAPAAPPPPQIHHPQFHPPQPDPISRFITRWENRAPRWLAPAAALGCVAAAVGYTLWSDPAYADADARPTCLLKYTTGLDCPGCGGTRAFWFLLHGDLPAAARHHLVFVFVLPFLVYLFAAWAGQRLFGRQLPQLRLSPTAIGVVLAAWALFSVARNLPWAPFAWFYV